MLKQWVRDRPQLFNSVEGEGNRWGIQLAAVGAMSAAPADVSGASASSGAAPAAVSASSGAAPAAVTIESSGAACAAIDAHVDAGAQPAAIGANGASSFSGGGIEWVKID